MSVELAVTISVDKQTVLAHRVGKDIGDINATYYATIVKVIAFSLMVIARHVRMDFGDGSASFVVTRHVSAHAEMDMGTAHLVTSDIGDQPAGSLAMRGALRHAHSPLEPVLRVLTGSGETNVSMRAQTVQHPNVSNQMDIVYFAKQASGEEIVPGLAVLVAHQTHVVCLMALVHLVLMDPGENDVISYAAKGV